MQGGGLSVQGRFLSVSLIRVSRGRLIGDAATSLDTQNLSDGGNKIVWRFEELRGWRERLAMIGRHFYDRLHRIRRLFKKAQLAEKFPQAVFQDLNGLRWWHGKNKEALF